MAQGRLAAVLPFLATTTAMAAFQTGAAVAKSLFPAVGPEGAAALRLVLGGLILTGLVRPWRAWPSPAPLVPLIGLGLSMGGAVLMFYLAISRLPLGVAIALQFLGPLSVAILASRRPTDGLWALLAAVAVWALVGVRDAVGIDPRGVGFALGAAAGWAGYILFGRVASAAFGRSTAALSTLVAALVVLPVGVSHAGGALLAPSLLPLAMFVALLSVALPVSLEMYALPRMPARTFAVFTSLEPAFGVLSGLILLGERLAPAQVGGIALVITAAVGAAWSSGRSR